MSNFLSFVGKNVPAVAEKLRGKTPGTESFNKAWRDLASSDSKGFDDVQHRFIKSTHYDPVVSEIGKMGLNVNSRSSALQNVVWSVAVQHGVGGARNLIRSAMNGQPNISDEALIKRIYAERSANNGKKYFPSSSESIRKSVVGRFERELKDALNML